MSNNLRESLLNKTAGLRKTSDIKDGEVPRNNRTQTAPGLAGALAVAQLRVQELEAKGTATELLVVEIGPNPWQPRRKFNEAKMAELAESIREVGLMQPIVVRRVETGYQIVAGERRWRAHKILGLENIKAVVAGCSDEDMAVLALVENMGRDDLSDYEISLSLQRSVKEFPNRKRLAEALGLSKQGLHRFLAFEGLPDFIRADLDLEPGLLGGNAAEALASALKKHGEAAVAAAKELWPSVSSGQMAETKLAPAVIAVATRKGTPAVATERTIDKFFSGKKQAGSLTKDVNSLTLKIKRSMLTDAQEVRIRQLMNELFSENPGQD
ncbi:ParB/RepB/Spo0J family partition protein [Arthrobacter sp. NPDC080086]|uniref:ParB/RepB/Spo0J family partition protein n=1 Tax=Arthrobacter sp. NPDC080086 TaxID=3155917 RepID=UPI0034505621